MAAPSDWAVRTLVGRPGRIAAWRVPIGDYLLQTGDGIDSARALLCVGLDGDQSFAGPYYWKLFHRCCGGLESRSARQGNSPEVVCRYLCSWLFPDCRLLFLAGSISGAHSRHSAGDGIVDSPARIFQANERMVDILRA